jgi:Site-specific recombinase XerD
MSIKRRDNKNRILQNGESQRKDGRYMYKYIDNVGKTKYLYSWKLVKTDTAPRGVKNEVPLRDKIKMVQRDLNDGIIPSGDDTTVAQLVEKYVSLKTGVRESTQSSYRYVVNILKKEEFGRRRIDKVRLSDAKIWLIKLQKDGRGYSSIQLIRDVVKPAFQMAVDDDLLRKNPFNFQLTTVVVNDSVARKALTKEQERLFLDFIKEDDCFCAYYDAVYILFHTGLRISEFAGLTVSDIDLENGIINVDHQLLKGRNGKYTISTPKTEYGTRLVPMTDEVKACFAGILKNRSHPEEEPIVDGKSGFLYLDKNDMPMIALHWENCFQEIREKYNKMNSVPMPYITPHVCRHTFCSNMAKAGMNPKILQKIMGHSNVGITLNVYTHIDFEDVQKEMQAVCSH